MDINKIARVAHQINKAFCESIGDTSQPDWNDAPEWQKNSAINGVKFHIDNPNSPPHLSHENWLAEKVKDGWSYGEVKDPELKRHPCFRPYTELPNEQKSKDYLFVAIVHELTKED